MTQNTKNLLILGIVIIAMFFIGRGSKTPETKYIESPSDDSLRIELRKLKESNRIKDSLLDLYELRVDSLILDDKVAVVKTKINKKKRYESTQKMSYDSAIVARNILLDSAINAQRRIREAESNSDN